MCVICSDFQAGKLTLEEALKNNLEVNSDNEHFGEVIEMLDIASFDYSDDMFEYGEDYFDPYDFEE